MMKPERNYGTYMGSLTTPPCAEGVTWILSLFNVSGFCSSVRGMTERLVDVGMWEIVVFRRRSGSFGCPSKCKASSRSQALLMNVPGTDTWDDVALVGWQFQTASAEQLAKLRASVPKGHNNRPTFGSAGRGFRMRTNA
nr:hypothetical protein PHYPA_030335 [Physcomitrium patens]